MPATTLNDMPFREDGSITVTAAGGLLRVVRIRISSGVEVEFDLTGSEAEQLATMLLAAEASMPPKG